MGNVDQKTITRHGITFTVHLDHDPDCDPRHDGDWASAKDVDMWRNDDWQYVDVVINIESDTALGEAVFVLGAVAFGDGDDWSEDLDGIIERCVIEGWFEEAVQELQDRIAKAPAAIEALAADASTYRQVAELVASAMESIDEDQMNEDLPLTVESWDEAMEYVHVEEYLHPAPEHIRAMARAEITRILAARVAAAKRTASVAPAA